MKCKVCYTENQNDAVYCKDCGKELVVDPTAKRGYHSLMLTIVFACVVLVVFAAIIGIDQLGELFAEKTSAEIYKKSTPVTCVIVQDDNAYIVASTGGKEEDCYVTKLDSAPDKVLSYAQGGILCKTDGSYWTCEGTALHKVPAKNIDIAQAGTSVAYLEGDKLYLFQTSPKLIAENVETFCISDSGTFVAYKLTDIDGTICVAELNGKSETVGIDKDCQEILFVSSDKGAVYYTTSDGSLRVALLAGKRRFEAKGYKRLIAHSDKSVLFEKTDGKTWLWDSPETEETCVYDGVLQEMLLPEGYYFAGEKLYDAVYTVDRNLDGEADGAIKLTKADGCVELCNDAKTMYLTNDNGFLFYVDVTDTLYRADSLGDFVVKKCAENVDSENVVIAADNRCVYFLTKKGAEDGKGKLHYFDTMLDRSCNLDNSFRSISLSSEGYLLMWSKSKLYSFANHTLLEVTNKKAEAYTFGNIRGMDFYINAEGKLAFARADGTFTTAAEEAAKTAEDVTDSDDE